MLKKQYLKLPSGSFVASVLQESAINEIPNSNSDFFILFSSYS